MKTHPSAEEMAQRDALMADALAWQKLVSMVEYVQRNSRCTRADAVALAFDRIAPAPRTEP